MKNKPITIYMVQEIIDGIGDCPRLFRDEKSADKCFVDLVNENFGKDFKEYSKAQKFFDNIESESIDILYFIEDLK